jgi:ribulose-5-phosphate 4-epimerase/fuculose-1-phosphate aldolase
MPGSRRRLCVLEAHTRCQHSAAPRQALPAPGSAAGQLARAYKVLHATKQYDLLWGLISLAVGEDEFLVVRFGVPFNRVRVADIIAVNAAGDVLSADASAGEVVVHPAWPLLAQVHTAAGQRATCVVHSHDDDVSLFAATRQPVLPLNQDSMMFYEQRCVSWATEDDPAFGGSTPLEAALAPSTIAVNLLNHGSLVFGKHLPLAMMRHYYYCRAVRLQLRAQMVSPAAAVQLSLPPADVVETLLARWEKDDPIFREMTWEWETLLEELGL